MKGKTTILAGVDARRCGEMPNDETLRVLHDVFEFSPIPTVVTDGVEGSVLCVNRQFVEVFGYGRDEVRSVGDWWPLAHPDPHCRQQVREEWLRYGEVAVREKQLASPMEATVTCKDGAVRDVEFHLRIVHGLCIVSMIDLTRHKKAEKALRASEEKHRTLFELESDALFLIDNHSGEILEANPAAATLYGYSRESLIGMKDTQLSAQSSEARRSALAGQREIPTRQHRRRDGTVFPVEIRASHMDWLGIDARIAAVRDITERERVEASLARSSARLARALNSTVNALATTTELRDPYTAGHQQRVAQLAAAIAEELDWAGAPAETMYVAGLLHDIGKIVVPSEILSKPGKLSEVEMDLMRRHAEVGASVLAEIDFEDQVAEMIHQHHERLDGSGYPRGLHGPDILPGARILAVADVVEAMQSHRPFRPALGSDAALEFVSAHAGTLFDVEVVAACRRTVSEGFEFLP